MTWQYSLGVYVPLLLPRTPEAREFLAALATPLSVSQSGVLDVLIRRHATPLFRPPSSSLPVIPLYARQCRAGVGLCQRHEVSLRCSH